mgnify:CR=1 FL=1
MKKFIGFEPGMGIGGWLTTYKRFNVIPEEKRLTLTVGDFEHFKSYITESDVKYIASLGMDHIRLGFDQIVVERAPYEYRTEITDLIENFINWCIKYNINVVLNLHKAIGNYCDISEKIQLLDNEELQQRFIALWIMLENRFSKYPNVAFELLNEVRDAEPNKWNDLAEKTINEIRKINLNRKIIIGTICWNSISKLADLRLYDDDNVIYTFHTYEPFSFTHQRGVLQPGPMYYNRDMPYPSDIERYKDYESVVNNNENAYLQYKKMDIEFIWDALSYAINFTEKNPDNLVWCGEFGTIRHSNIEWRENWMHDVISVLIENNIPYCVWNYLSTSNDGNRFSLVDDDSRKILSNEMAKIIRGEI